ncbi:DNA repair protein RadC [Alteromonas pelagimontana]|uniref:DNA repair protein RadC n=1 Tax=Alteromonas pelagimontana TaxID=1858656 RepID=A0A6M4MD24_9ALTE|nr:DNA repair protein RadC [Alteromonas pelagimontana]QJR81022.1 DNA repair protein RadC [Alteromonas pelagimontana]
MENVKSWPLLERPREKLLHFGPAGLSDAELLAVLLGSGMVGRCVMTVARELLQRFGSLGGIAKASKQEFCAVHGIGEVKYAQLQSALEVTRRVLEEPLRRQSAFHHVNDVTRYIQAHLKNQEKEHFGMLLLDSQHQLIVFRIMFTGTINSAAVYPRELVKQVLADNAAAIILVHNHPSGVPEPSQADISLTRDVVSAMALIDVSVLDHFIVGDTKTVSMAQRGLL